MHIFSPTSHIRRLLVALTLLPLLCACYDYSMSDIVSSPVDTPQIATANQYINLSIVVSAGNEGTTRADEKPAGGEDGDGREAGYEWENKVDGVTFILYAANSINEVADNDTVSFFKYYPVDLVPPRENSGTQYPSANPNPSKKNKEAVYTTGDQPVEGLNLSTKYRAIVVANLDLTNENKFKNATEPIKVKDVLDYTVARIHDGSNVGATAKSMIMSLESDYEVDFENPSATNQTTNANGTKLTYIFDEIRIERLAARIDFWTNKTYKPSDAGDGEHSGYEYPVYKSTDTDNNPTSGDKFILTAITPFNCYSSTEYLFKRIWDSKTEKSEYLADEPQTYIDKDLYVLDPMTKDKKADNTSINRRSFMTYELDKIIGNTGNWDKNPRITIKSIKTSNNQWGNTLRTSEDGKGPDTIIVCYPKENTLLKDSPLYYYATGLRIEGDYYEEGWENETVADGAQNPKVTHLIYYGFLRHQGENTTGTYEIYSKEYLEENKDKLVGKHPMNFGVVRNNIYRISIDRITERGNEPPQITWEIKVKKWDKFTHDTIYM